MRNYTLSGADNRAGKSATIRAIRGPEKLTKALRLGYHRIN
jgi:hypothetical protein